MVKSRKCCSEEKDITFKDNWFANTQRKKILNFTSSRDLWATLQTNTLMAWRETRWKWTISKLTTGNIQWPLSEPLKLQLSKRVTRTPLSCTWIAKPFLYSLGLLWSQPNILFYLKSVDNERVIALESDTQIQISHCHLPARNQNGNPHLCGSKVLALSLNHIVCKSRHFSAACCDIWYATNGRNSLLKKRETSIYGVPVCLSLWRHSHVYV